MIDNYVYIYIMNIHCKLELTSPNRTDFFPIQGCSSLREFRWFFCPMNSDEKKSSSQEIHGNSYARI